MRRIFITPRIKKQPGSTIIVRNQRFFNEPGWRNNEKLMGGGALIDGGIHFIEALLDLGGEYKQIHSSVYKGSASIEGEDNTAALFSFNSGATGLFFYSWSYKDPPHVPSYEIVGTGGSITESTEERHPSEGKELPTVCFGKPVLNGTVQEIEEKDVIDMEISGFVGAIEKNEKVPYPPELARRNLEAVLKIYGKI